MKETLEIMELYGRLTRLLAEEIVIMGTFVADPTDENRTAVFDFVRENSAIIVGLKHDIDTMAARLRLQ